MKPPKCRLSLDTGKGRACGGKAKPGLFCMGHPDKRCYQPYLPTLERLEELYEQAEPECLKGTRFSGMGLPHEKESFMAGAHAVMEELGVVEILEVGPLDALELTGIDVHEDGPVLLRPGK